MANMSYCQFQNTCLDLEDCKDAIAYPDEENLSKEEEFAKIRLVRLCRDIVYMIDHPDEIDNDDPAESDPV